MTRSFYGEFDGSIDTDDLAKFLTDHLGYLSPYLHEWGYMQQGGLVTGTIMKTVSESLKEVILCTEYGPKRKRLATICIRPHVMNPDSGRMQYIVGAENNGVTFYRLDTRFPIHICLFKTAPILQAAMKYYLKSKEGAE